MKTSAAAAIGATHARDFLLKALSSRRALALLAGASLPLAFAPFDLWPAALVAPALLFWCLAPDRAASRVPLARGSPAAARGREPARSAAFAIGWWFGVGKFGVGASWIYVSIHLHGGASPLLAGGLVALFVGGLALLHGVHAWSYARFLATGDWLRDALAFAASFVLVEWVLTWVLTGFPWLYLGYAHLATPLRHWAPVSGVLGISLMTALSACAVVAVLLGRSRRHRFAAIGVAALPWLLGGLLGHASWVAPEEHGSVALVQGNVPQEVKWNADRAQWILARYRELSEPLWRIEDAPKERDAGGVERTKDAPSGRGTDVVIWPEAAVTLLHHQVTGYLDVLASRARASGSALILGIPAWERTPGGEDYFLNTAIVVGEGEGRYVKRRLVPFGEYVPLETWLRGTIEFFDLPMSRSREGASDQPLLTARGWNVGMAICYEIVYPELVRELAARADVLATISNDTWFGRSVGPHQHMQMAQMRALENGRWLLRATNNGVTAIVNHEGRIVDRLPQFEAGVLRGEFLTMTGHTPFTRTGSMPVVLVALAITLYAWVAARRRRSRVDAT